MKTETINDFLARGGKIQRFQEAERNKDTNVLPVKANVDYENLSLAYGEMMYGEPTKKKTKKEVVEVDANSVIENSSLPQEVIDAIKKSVEKV